MLDLQPIKDRIDAFMSGRLLLPTNVNFTQLMLADIVALVAEVERLREENQTLREELSEAKKELDDVYRMNPFYKERPDA